MSTVNPENVAALRAVRHWSLDRLADEAKVDRQTIHRVETGKIAKPRSHTLESLAKALGTTVEVLCGPTVAIKPPASTETSSKSQMNVRISDFARNALSLLSIRYGIKPSHILEAAPLLFHCCAEISLKLRQQRLDDFRRRLGELREQGLDHLRVDALDNWEIDQTLDWEQDSISRKDVFGYSIYDSDQASDYYGTAFVSGDNNPLRNYLAALANEAGGAEVSSFYKDFGIDYELGRDEITSLMNGDEQAAEHIVAGRVLIHEIPKNLWEAAKADERVRWVLERGEEWLKEHPPLDISKLKLDHLFEKSADASKGAE